MMSRRPSRRKINDVVNWLAGIGVELYGPNVDLETGELSGFGYMDFTADEAIRLYELKKANKLIQPED